MVARLLRLRIDVLLGSFRSGSRHALGLLLGLVYVVAATAALLSGLAAVRGADDPALSTDVVVAGGAFALAGFVLVPLLFGGDDPMDPRAFSLYGIRTPVLAGALAFAAVISVPLIALAVVAFASASLWSSAGWAVLSVVIALATAAVFARIAVAVSTFFFSARAAREVLGVIGVVLVLAMVPAVLVATNIDWGDQGRDALAAFAGFARWTPFGVVWAVPGAAESGDVASAVASLVAGLLTLAAALVVWFLVVRMMLAAPERSGHRRGGLRLGWFDGVRATPAGVIAARSITYWGRDPRYHLSLVAVPLLPVVIIALFGSVGVPWSLLALIPLPIIVFFLGWSMHNDLAYDGSAVWLHVASGVRGVADRLGRTFPTLVIGLPIVLIGSLGTAFAFGDPGAYAAILGANLGILLALVGVSSFVSARFPYPASRPGDSPFVQPQAPGSSGAGSQTLSFVAGVILSAPSVALGVQALFVDGSLGGATLLCGLLLGGVVLWLGITVGGRVFDRRGPELVAFASRY